MFDDIPDLGNATLMAGYIIDLHSDSDSVHAGRGTSVLSKC